MGNLSFEEHYKIGYQMLLNEGMSKEHIAMLADYLLKLSISTLRFEP
jgi:hypothetical protein